MSVWSSIADRGRALRDLREPSLSSGRRVNMLPAISIHAPIQPEAQSRMPRWRLASGGGRQKSLGRDEEQRSQGERAQAPRASRAGYAFDQDKRELGRAQRHIDTAHGCTLQHGD